MPETILTENDYNILYTGILNYTRLLSSNACVEGIYCTSYIHNYHNLFSKPIIDITVISNMQNGELTDLADNMEEYNKIALIRINVITHKAFIDVNNRDKFEITDSTILYDKYGEYHRIQKEFRDSQIATITNPRVMRLNYKFNKK